jgi:hypothetical protein
MGLVMTLVSLGVSYFYWRAGQSSRKGIVKEALGCKKLTEINNKLA